MESSGSLAWLPTYTHPEDVAALHRFKVWLVENSPLAGKRADCDAHLRSFWWILKKGVALTPEQEQSVDAHCTCPKKKERKGNGTPLGAFAFTLTKSPKDPYSVGDMLTAVRKIMSQKSCPVVKYAWYYEEKGRDENGDPIHPHIHGMYETATGGRIETKHWKRAWPIWEPDKPMGAGFRGGYHRPVRDSEGYSDYIKKDGGMSEHRTEQTD